VTIHRHRGARATALAAIVFTALATVPPAPIAEATEPHLVEFTGSGWGHGVGLSQFGAHGMARDGASAAAIVEHYYTGASIRTLGDDLPAAEPLWVNLERDRTEVTIVAEPRAALTRDTVTADIAPGTSIVIRPVDGGCEVTVGAEAPAQGSCDIDIERAEPGLLSIAGCTVTDWNVDPVVESPCGYEHGVMHVRPGVEPGTVHVVLELGIEEYLLGISEMPYRWGNEGATEALRAQVIAARSYAHHLQLSRGEPADSICAGWCHVRDTTWDQRYVGDDHGGADRAVWIDAVTSTAGQVLVHPEGNIRPAGSSEGVVLAYYSSSTGGRTEDRAEVWGGDRIPYLRSVDDPWSLDDVNPNASWSVGIGGSVVADALGIDSVSGARIIERRTSGSAATIEFSGSEGGRPVTVERPGGWALTTFGLRSQYFDVEVVPFLPADRVALHEPATGRWYLHGGTGPGPSFFYGNPADQPFAGDWDGDGIDTPGLYRVSIGFVFLRNRNTEGVADTRIYYGNPGDLPVAGDWDGDGIDTIGVYRPSQARFYLRNANTQGVADVTITFGNPGDLPLAGDWDGDGIDTIGVYRPSTRMVYLSNGGNRTDLAWRYGGATEGDLIIAGDWDGDGHDTIGLFRPDERRFYLRDAFDAPSASRIFDWDALGSTPVAGDWG
jgi:SpoIID/LytB domain protein